VAWRTTDEVFAAADVISLHCPLTPESTGMVNRDRLAKMKRSGLLVNSSRGGLVVEADLADALRQGVLAGAAVDVVSREPIHVDNPLLGAPNCLITPHMAWTSLAARKRLMDVTAKNVAAFLAGSPIHVVN
jgi:glycerate dehydrogenase